MALSPLSTESQRITYTSSYDYEPSLTYNIDLESGRIKGKIDGENALRQFIWKALSTVRYRFIIYGEDYGCEAENYIGDGDVTDDLIRAEFPRLIREALIYDDRISSVTDFEFTKDGDKLYVTFMVTASDGAVFDQEVSFSVG